MAPFLSALTFPSSDMIGRQVWSFQTNFQTWLLKATVSSSWRCSVQLLAIGLVYKIPQRYPCTKDVHDCNSRGSSTNPFQPRFGSKKNDLICLPATPPKMWNSLLIALNLLPSKRPWKVNYWQLLLKTGNKQCLSLPPPLYSFMFVLYIQL